MALQKPIKCLFRNNNITSITLFNVFRRNSSQTPNFASCHRDIGSREIVGPGRNGDCTYVDESSFPFPAIRFREITSELLPLKEKEKGDWRNLSLEEKKTLYRASFCQTYAEMLVPSKQWKSIVGKALVFISLGIWLHLGLQWIWAMELPNSYSDECQRAQLERILVLEVNPIFGISSKWDYDNDRWK